MIEHLRGLEDENFPGHSLMVLNDEDGTFVLFCLHSDCEWTVREFEDDKIPSDWYYAHGIYCRLKLNI